MSKLSDPHGGTRSKVVQSIGKMARIGYLNNAQKKQATEALEAILGIDGRHEWDSAFNVRREAEIAYQCVTGKIIEITGPCGNAENRRKTNPAMSLFEFRGTSSRPSPGKSGPRCDTNLMCR